MKKFLSVFKRRPYEEETESEEDYVELNPEDEFKRTSKVSVKIFSLEDFADVKNIIDSLREGYVICLVNIRPLKEKDLIELKRAINKIKKTCEAIDGDIAGFGEDYLVATPSFARISREEGESKSAEKMSEKK